MSEAKKLIDMTAEERQEHWTAEARANVLTHDQRLWVRTQYEKFCQQVASMQNQIGGSSIRESSALFLVGVYSKQVGRLTYMAETLRLDDLHRERAGLERLNDWTEVAR